MTETKDLGLYQIHEELSRRIWASWREVRGNVQVDDVKFSRITLLSLVHAAAVLGVDTHMPQDQFIELCTETFASAYEQAPKFS